MSKALILLGIGLIYLLLPQPAQAALCAFPVGGNFTVNASCSVTGIIGTDNGTLTISGSGVTVTIGQPGTPATLVFSTIIKSGGASIQKAAQSSLLKTSLWMRDNDGDGWPASTSVAAATSAPSIDSQPNAQSKRRYTMNAGAWSTASQSITTTDCNDNAYSTANSCCDPNTGQNCNCNACGSCGGTVQCNGSCSGSTPVTPYILGASCNCNVCGSCGGTITNACTGNCSGSTPPTPYQSSCTICNSSCPSHCVAGTQNVCTGTGCNANATCNGQEVWACQSNNLMYNDGTCWPGNCAGCAPNVGGPQWGGSCVYGVTPNSTSGCSY